MLCYIINIKLFAVIDILKLAKLKIVKKTSSFLRASCFHTISHFSNIVKPGLTEKNANAGRTLEKAVRDWLVQIR